MKGMKKIWLPATFGLLFGNFFSLPVEARSVTVTTSDAVDNITAIGNLAESQFDIVDFGHGSSTVNLTPDLVPNPNLAQSITLGQLTFAADQGNCGSAGCSGPVVKTLQFSVFGTGKAQVVDLTFTWDTSWFIDPDLGPLRQDACLSFNNGATGTACNPSDSPNGGTQVVSSFLPSPFRIPYGFDSLLITLLQPQDIIQPVDAQIYSYDIKALVQLIPEPSSLPLMGLGLAALAFARRRNKLLEL